MYFPYLYGKQSERFALIDVVGHLGAPQKVVPILEPYSPARDLTKVLDAFAAASAQLHLVVNPTRGGLQTPDDQAAWAAAMATPLAQSSVIIPTLHVFAATTAAEITSFFTIYAGRQVGLVILAEGVAPTALAPLLHGAQVRVFIGPRVAPTDYQAALTGIPVIPLAPRFTVLRNADYPAVSPFSLDPASYRPDVFGDFMILDPKPPRVGPGGGNGAGAVAVHMTYQDTTTSELRVQHFLSDDRTAGAPPIGVKLLQAIAHLDAEQAASGRFLPSPGFAALHQLRVDGHETNLAKSKRQQLSHHLFTVAAAL